MKQYELVTILHPHTTEDEVNAFVKTVEDGVTENGGELTDRTIQMKHRLAYPIQKQRTGHMIRMEVYADPANNVAEMLERITKTQDQVLRRMTVTKEKHEQQSTKQEGESESVIDQLRRQARGERKHPEHSEQTTSAQERDQKEADTKEPTDTPADIKEIDKRIEELLT